MPNPRKPPALKAISGTVRPDRDAQPVVAEVDKPLEVAPPSPDWLADPVAIMEWERVVSDLVDRRLLNAGSLTALGHYCALHGLVTRAYMAGKEPQASSLGQMVALAREFGLTTASAQKVKPQGAAPDRPANPFGSAAPRPVGVVR